MGSKAGQRVPTSHSAHHSMASSRLLDPMKNISRWGAQTSALGDREERAGAGWVSMGPSLGAGEGGCLDVGQIGVGAC